MTSLEIFNKLSLYYKGYIFDEKGAAIVAYSSLKAFQEMHSKQIIHRDIKPGNILCTELGEVKIGDFGAMGELSDSFNARTFTGTMLYMSPERLRGEDYSVESDIWSLGVTLITIMTGQYPFSIKRGYWGLIASIRDEEERNEMKYLDER
jgi:serine/threonine protein kinase